MELIEMNDRWIDRLSEYLDGELTAEERHEFEAHLAECQECSETLEQLRRVVDRAGSLTDRSPASNLWPGIAGRIGATPEDEDVTGLDEYRQRKHAGLKERRFTFSVPQLAAASVALMVLSGGSAWLAVRATGPEQETVVIEAPTQDISGAASFVATPYEAAVAELDRVLLESRDRLDTATVRVIEENLRIIDRAIAQAQQALTQDPGSIYLHEHLAVTKRQKLEFLRQAVQMAGAVS
jgi:anti-sigma factor RsiW